MNMNKELEEIVRICTDESDDVPTPLQSAVFVLWANSKEENETDAELAATELAAITADRDRLTGELAEAIPLRKLADLMHKLEEHNARAAGCWVDLKIALTYLQLAAHPEQPK
jgi:hypothetical protein